MKKVKTIMLFALLWVSTTGCTDVLLEYEESFTEHILDASSINGESYKIKVALPPSYNQNSERNYPVIFQLDGDEQFETMAETARQLAASNEISEVVVVGIGYTEYDIEKRTRDLTFPAEEGYEETTGGAQEFHDFMSQMLVPFISDNYHVDIENMTLSGHSLAGFYTLYELFEYGPDELFQNYIVASPSLHYHNGIIIDFYDTFTDGPADRTSAKLFMTNGSLEFIHLITYQQALRKRIQADNLPYLDESYAFYEDTFHTETKIPSYRDGLKFIF